MSNIYYPDYFVRYKCLADRCPDTCCAAWEICIDTETIKKYDALNGKLGEVIRKQIAIDEDGEPFFRLKKGKCPFLNENRLCAIHMELGENYTSEVCREHPKFTEIYDDFTEISLSASCPAANELIFSEPFTKETYPSPVSATSDELLCVLIEARKQLLCYAAEKNADITGALRELKNKSREVSELFYTYDDSYELFYEFDGKITALLEKYLLENSEILTPTWKELLLKSCGTVLSVPSFADNIAQNRDKLLRAFAYLVYRYFPKAVNDEMTERNGAFISVCLLLCIDIAVKTGFDFRDCFRLFSKETEHDTENIETIRSFLSERGNIEKS